MKKLQKYTCYFSCLLTAGVLLVSACSDDSSTASSTGIAGMYGTVATSAHDYWVRDSAFFLSASGITTPAQSEISYQWTITDTATTGVWGQLVKYKTPDTTPALTLTLTAAANGYYSTSVVKPVTLIERTFAETVKGIASGSTFTDARDGQAYQYKHIGARDWMTQNLHWNGAGKVYKSQNEYGIVYGRLYLWEEAASTATPICPAGWEVPDNAAWEDLGKALNGGSAVAFTTEWQKLGSKATANGTINDKPLLPYDPNNIKENTQGWNALLAGKAAGNVFSDAARYGYWWSATPYNANQSYYRYIIYNHATFFFNYGDNDGLYLSVRCVR